MKVPLSLFIVLSERPLSYSSSLFDHQNSLVLNYQKHLFMTNLFYSLHQTFQKFLKISSLNLLINETCLLLLAFYLCKRCLDSFRIIYFFLTVNLLSSFHLNSRLAFYFHFQGSFPNFN